jgi:hypothetical protein
MGGGVEILPKGLDKTDSTSSSSKSFKHHRESLEKPAKPERTPSSSSGRNSDRNSSPLSLALVGSRSTPEKVAPTSSTPPHRPWLNATELNIPQPKPKVEPDLNAPLQNGWKRETVLKGLGAHGLNGDVTYVSPNNVTVKSMQELKKLVGNNGLKNYSFSSRLLIGDFLLPSEDGNVLKLTSSQLANWLRDESRESKKEEERVKGERERKKEHAGLVRGTGITLYFKIQELLMVLIPNFQPWNSSVVPDGGTSSSKSGNRENGPRTRRRRK